MVGIWCGGGRGSGSVVVVVVVAFVFVVFTRTCRNRKTFPCFQANLEQAESARAKPAAEVLKKLVQAAQAAQDEKVRAQETQKGGRIRGEWFRYLVHCCYNPFGAQLPYMVALL